MNRLNTNIINFLKVSTKIRKLVKELEKEWEEVKNEYGNFETEDQFVERNSEYFSQLKSYEDEFYILFKAIQNDK